MGLASPPSAKTANQATVVRFPRSEADFTVFRNISAVLRAFWPIKTAAKVAYLTNVSERSVKFWLAGETRMSLEHVTALLKTDAGFDILKAILGDECKAEWWLVTQSAQDIRKSRKAIKREQERIEATRAQLDLLDQ
jgi:hypothetical protein